MKSILCSLLLIFCGYFLYAQQVENGLVAYYSFDDCADIGKDDSGNNTSAVVQGNQPAFAV